MSAPQRTLFDAETPPGWDAVLRRLKEEADKAEEARARRRKEREARARKHKDKDKDKDGTK